MKLWQILNQVFTKNFRINLTSQFKTPFIGLRYSPQSRTTYKKPQCDITHLSFFIIEVSDLLLSFQFLFANIHEKTFFKLNIRYLQKLLSSVDEVDIAPSSSLLTTSSSKGQGLESGPAFDALAPNGEVIGGGGGGGGGGLRGVSPAPSASATFSGPARRSFTSAQSSSSSASFVKTYSFRRMMSFRTSLIR